MSNNTAETEVVRRIHIDKCFLEVGDAEANDAWIELRTVGKENIEYFGAISLNLQPIPALQLGLALIEAAKLKGAK